MVRKTALFLLVLLVIPLVLAVDTQITITASPSRNITINVMDHVNYNLLKTIEGVSSEAGVFSTTFSVDKSSVDIAILVRKDGRLEIYKKFENQNTGSPIDINLLAETAASTNTSTTASANTANTTSEASNVTSSNDSAANTTAASEEESQTVTGAVISESEGENFLSKIPKVVYFVIAGLIFAAIVVFISIKTNLLSSLRMPRVSVPSTPMAYKVRKYSEITSVDEKKLLDAEKKIKAAQEEIDRIKNKKAEIDEAERRFDEAKRNLEKLKGGKI